MMSRSTEVDKTDILKTVGVGFHMKYVEEVEENDEYDCSMKSDDSGAPSQIPDKLKAESNYSVMQNTDSNIKIYFSSAANDADSS